MCYALLFLLFLVFGGCNLHHKFHVQAQMYPCMSTIKLIDSNGASGDNFGGSVDVSGTNAVIGSDMNDDYGDYSGGAFIFSETSVGVWTQIQTLVPSDAATVRRFGALVTISGSTVIVSSLEPDIFVFAETLPGVWTEVQVISNIPGFTGWPQISKISDVQTVILTCHPEVYVYSETSTNVWTEVYQLNPTEILEPTAYFGKAVALCRTGNTAVVGAMRSDDGGAVDSGAAYVFSSTSPSSWSQVKKLKPSHGGYAEDEFGQPVAVDGPTIAVGCQYEDVISWQSGGLYVFTEISPGNWIEDDVINPSECSDRFPNAVAVFGTAILGACHGCDAVYYFIESSPGSWVEDVKIDDTAPFPDEGGSFAMISETKFLMGTPPYGGYGAGNGEAFFIELHTGALDCSSSPCLNSGSCGASGGECDSGFTCDCTGTNYMGTLCEIPQGCSSNPCQNSGICTNDEMDLSQFSCDCTTTGYQGSVCQADVDDCASAPCLNTGTCVDGGANIFSCNCDSVTTGYTGETCQTDIDDCVSSPCLNNGTCLDVGANMFICSCLQTGFDGDLCQNDVDDCESSPCLNSGSCIDTGINNFLCICTGTGFDGDICQYDVDDCFSSPCLNDGVCTDNGPNSFICDCSQTGFYGDVCSTDVNVCESSPCLNSGVCLDNGVNDFLCSCPTGHEGPICEIINIDDCSSSPCLNSGICVDLGANMFDCDCSGTGFQDDTCATDSDDCSSSPCLNNGRCTDAGIHAFDCDCSETGYDGDFCEFESDVSEPAEQPNTNSTVSNSTVTLVIHFSGFNRENGATAETIVSTLPELLAREVGGTPGDYLVTVEDYAITIVYRNPEQENAEDIEKKVNRIEELDESLYNWDVQIIQVNEEEETTTDDDKSDVDRILYAIILVLGILVFVSAVYGAYRYNQSQRKLVKNIYTGQTMRMPT